MHKAVHVGRPTGRPTLGPVDRPGRPPEPGSQVSGSEKQVLKVFLCQKGFILFVLEFFGKIKENRKLGDLYWFSFLSFIKSFPKYFSLSFYFPNSSFFHT